jgi:hypothetical protein
MPCLIEELINAQIGAASTSANAFNSWLLTESQRAALRTFNFIKTE